MTPELSKALESAGIKILKVVIDGKETDLKRLGEREIPYREVINIEFNMIVEPRPRQLIKGAELIALMNLKGL